MSLSKRIAALETTGAIDIKDVRLASNAQLALYLAQTPLHALRTELANYSDPDFAVVVNTIREHVPAYGGSYAVSQSACAAT